MVSSGPELLAALERLQLAHARVLISLAANISLPVQPTPQRADPAPGDDDALPLVPIYRNVTLAGLGGAAAAAARGAAAGILGSAGEGTEYTEIDFRMRRNAFGVAAGWQMLQQRQVPAPAPAAPASGSDVYWRGRPVLVLAGVAMANTPPGPPGSWPLGLLGTFNNYVGMDRSGSGGLQLVALRTRIALVPGMINYLNYWYRLMSSLLPEERAAAEWLQRISDPPRRVPDADGGFTYMARVGDFLLAFNASASGTPFLTPSASADYDLWSSSPAGQLLSRPTAAANGSAALSQPLPPASFAVAANATQLLGLLQEEAWTGGPRIILLLRNITLSAEEWPQAGAALSYNVTLAGPVSGEPVQLDTGGMQLVRPAAAAAAALGSGGGGGGDGPVVVVLLQRLVLLGLSSQLLEAGRQDVAAAGDALGGSAGLEHWRDRCLASFGGGVGNASAAAAAGRVLWEVRDSTLVLPEGSLQVLQRYNDPAACGSGLDTASRSAAAAAACRVVARSAALPDPLASLLRKSLAIQGQAAFNASGTAVSTPSIRFTFAALGGFTLADSVAIAGGAGAASSSSAGAPASDSGPACSVETLLLALLALASLAAEPAGSKDQSAAYGGAAAGASVGFLLLIGVVTAVAVRRRRRLRRGLPSDAESAQGDGKAAAAGDKPAPGSSRFTDVEDSAGIGGGDNPGFGREPTVTIACSEKSMSRRGTQERRSDNNFSASFFMQGGAAAAAAAAAQTMADMASLGFTPELAGPPAPAGLLDDAPGAEPRAATDPRVEVLEGRAASRPATEAGMVVNATERRRRSLEQTASAAAGGSTSPANSAPRSRGSLRTAMADEIESMLRRCQAVTAAGSSSGARPRSKRMQLLGRGAYGAVYLSDWRGLPAAIKIMLLGPGESAGRRERLAREVALTVTLDHPNIVPTYDYKLSAIRAESLDKPPLSGDDAAAPAGVDDSDELAGLRLRLVMQYCEGGSLRKALEAGAFSAPQVAALPAGPSSVPGLPRLTTRAAPPSLPGVVRAPGQLSAALPGVAAVAAAANASAGRAASGVLASLDLGPSGAAEAAPAALVPPAVASLRLMEMLRRNSSTSASGPLTRPWSWAEVTAAANLPLSLLAALDILRGLEYLHGCGVVHGDLTDNNVLLKAAQPVLPLPQQLQPARTLPSPLMTTSSAAGARSVAAPDAAAPPPRQVAQARRLFPHDTAMGMSAAPEPPTRLAPSEAAPSAAGSSRRASGEIRVTLARTAWVADPPAPRRQEAAAAATAATPPTTTLKRNAGSAETSDGIPAPTAAGTAVATAVVVAAAAATRAAAPEATAQGSAGGAKQESTSAGLTSSSAAPPPANHSASAGESDMCGPGPAPLWSSTSEVGGQPSVVAVASQAGEPSCGTAFFMASPFETGDQLRLGAGGGGGGALVAAAQLLCFVFKIADFGLSVQLQGGSQTHVSGMAQGTPFFAAPEVVQFGRLSPAADIYSFGVLLWLLLHGVSLGQIRHLLPRAVHAPIGALLLRNAARSLPPAAHQALARALAPDPAQRPRAAELRAMVEEVLQDVAGSDLARLLFVSDRREHVAAPMLI